MITTPIDKPGARHAAVAACQLSPMAARRLYSRAALASARDYLALTKPRVMALAVFTAVVGLFAAPGRISPLTVVLTVLCVAMGAGAAGALNMWYDADIDARMARTAARPIQAGRLPSGEALAIGLTLDGF
jgi:heme o synthase